MRRFERPNRRSNIQDTVQGPWTNDCQSMHLSEASIPYSEVRREPAAGGPAVSASAPILPSSARLTMDHCTACVGWVTLHSYRTRQRIAYRKSIQEPQCRACCKGMVLEVHWTRQFDTSNVPLPRLQVEASYTALALLYGFLMPLCCALPDKIQPARKISPPP